MTSGYLPRVVDAEIETATKIAGALLIEGVRACGKTVTGEHHAASVVRLDTDPQALAQAELTPELLLDGETPRLIDEWQLAPGLWNQVRRTVDDRRKRGQFILTGSATPADDVTRHSGAGRILRLRMRPMSLFESGHSTGAVSLASIMDGHEVSGSRSGLDLAGVVERLCVGGWPGLQDLTPADAGKVLVSYLDDVARADILAFDDTQPRRNPMGVSRLLRAYSRHVATSASIATLSRDTGEDGAPLASETVNAYLNMLSRVMVVEEQPSWGPHLRSRDKVRQASTRHFVDPSLAVAALGAGPASLIRDPNTLGLLFESMVVRDLRVYVQALGGHILHYRDSSGNEADAVISLRDGRWAVVEVKLNPNHAGEAVASLDRLVNKLDLDRVGPPTARLVITTGEFAYTRPDGAIVAPLATLAP
jgi:predicted AAA+ superfamily ATPase